MTDSLSNDAAPIRCETAPDILTVCPLADLAGVRHAFFGRSGGVSEGPYASLNCGFGSRDAAERVARNRDRARAAINLEGGPLITAYQVHSPRVAVVEEPWPEGRAPQVDALVTRRRRASSSRAIRQPRELA